MTYLLLKSELLRVGDVPVYKLRNDGLFILDDTAIMSRNDS
ncbi:hypothetical protein [Nitrosomonas oligotropha]|nr:hypothetical protein [Nitrosomonas oligotropha]